VTPFSARNDDIYTLIFIVQFRSLTYSNAALNEKNEYHSQILQFCDSHRRI